MPYEQKDYIVNVFHKQFDDDFLFLIIISY